ncbi:MAG: Grx4 family monothiol glutaredoxin [Actinobacteria bacterium]|nr:Grx4 family monothiol glutaredoxin [Actinomycetota bacterium]
MSSLSPELRSKIESLIKSDEVVLFMKGSRSFPQCGFSAKVVSILNTLVPKYTTVNVLSDPDVRQGIKDYSEWPTIPQLYVRGELIGGSDIVSQLFESGELHKKLGVEARPAKAPTLTVTPRAASELKAAMADGGPGDVIHLTIDERFEHALDLGPKEPGHVTVESNGITVQLDGISAGRGEGVVIDFVEGPSGAGFKIENPNRPAGVKQIAPKELEAMLRAGTIKELFDVRTPKERETAKIAGARLLDDEAMAYLETLPKDTPIAFHCHHGGRSQNAASHFLGKGFTSLYNLAGGIDAWSRDVDPSIPRY